MHKHILKDSAKVILRMWSYAKPWRFKFYFGFLAGCTMPLFDALLLSLGLKMFTEAAMEKDFSLLIKVTVLFGGIMLLGMILYPVAFGFIYTTFARINGAMYDRFFQKAQRLSVSYVESKYSGDFISRITTDLTDAVQLVAYPAVGQNNPFGRIFAIVMIAVIICFYNWMLGGIALGIGIIGLIVNASFAEGLKKTEEKVKETSGKAAQNIVNTLSGAITARIFGLDEKLRNTYEKNTEDIYISNMSIIKKRSMQHALADLHVFIAFTGVTLIGLGYSSRGWIDIPSVLFIATMQMKMAENLAQVGQSFGALQKHIVGAERIFEFLDAPEEESGKETIWPANLKAKHALSIKGLVFTYSDTKDKVFSGFDLTVKNGERLAIIGGSGSGKSTLFKLLLGFSKKQGGEMTIYDHSIEAYSLGDLRRLFSYIPQECYLFDASIEENILWGNPMASKEELDKAIKDAYLEDFIKSLPQGCKTRVGERGAQLSGGQRQRITIARAFLNNAPIILLDEATSALDSESEQEVQKALGCLIKGRTSIVIAHRLSTIKHMDRIIVLEEGVNTEEGTHEELLKKGGRYTELFEMQFV